MKISKCLIASKALALFLILIFNTVIGLSQSKIQLKWGLDAGNYIENVVPLNKSPSKSLKVDNPQSKYRRFTPNKDSSKGSGILFSRQYKLWMDFSANTPDSLRTRLNFAKFVKNRDPYFYGIAKSLAPRLYFNFAGKGNQYILDSIKIKTIAFIGFASAGFSDSTAWYDIPLRHALGNHTYLDIKNRFRFPGSGNLVLRFWSDNFYKSMNGQTPSGIFFVEIRFYFWADGKEQSVSTEPFYIDV